MDDRTHMQAAMQALDESFNGNKPAEATDASWRKVGVVLFTFPYGDDSGQANYISNGADRRDMIPFLRETADRFERQVRGEDLKVSDEISAADLKGTIGEEIDKAGGKVELDPLARKLTDQGKIIEAGWHGYRRIAYKPTTPAGRLHEVRTAFMAGAQHLFASMIQIMESGEEPTEADLKRMDQIDAELRSFMREEFGVK